VLKPLFDCYLNREATLAEAVLQLHPVHNIHNTHIIITYVQMNYNLCTYQLYITKMFLNKYFEIE